MGWVWPTFWFNASFDSGSSIVTTQISIKFFFAPSFYDMHIIHTITYGFRIQLFALIRPAMISKLFPSGSKSMYSDDRPGRSGVVLNKP